MVLLCFTSSLIPERKSSLDTELCILWRFYAPLKNEYIYVNNGGLILTLHWGFFSVVVIKYSDKSNWKENGFISVHGPWGSVHYGRGSHSCKSLRYIGRAGYIPPMFKKQRQTCAHVGLTFPFYTVPGPLPRKRSALYKNEHQLPQSRQSSAGMSWGLSSGDSRFSVPQYYPSPLCPLSTCTQAHHF